MQKVVEGILTNYETWGTKGEYVVIMHGWGNSLDQWKKVGHSLADKYKVVVVDLPGFGGTPRPGDDWGVYEYGEWVVGFLKKMGIKKCILMGHSFGGRLAIVVAAKNSNLVSKLVLVDAAGIEIKTLKAKLFSVFAPILRNVVPQWVKNIFGSPDYKTAGDMRKIFIKTVNEDLRHLFGAIQAPTLVVWGERDMLLPISQGEMMRKGMRGAILRVVWGATHWPHLEKTEDFLRILEEEGV